jgi:hypothetical protein
MPLQRRKKRKKAPPKKAGGMSQVQNVKVVVNAAGTAPRRRRRAPAKKKDAGFSFGGGGGVGGLAQVVSGPSVSQDVLQQSQELRQTLSMLQAGPLRNNAVLGEIGQIERPLIAADDQPVSRAQLKYIMGNVIEQQSLQNEAMTQGFDQYRALAGSQLKVLENSIHSLSTNKQESPAVDRSESPVTIVPPPVTRGRSPTVRESSMAAEPGTPPATPSPQPTSERKKRTTYPQSVKDRVYTAWSENRQLPKGLQKSLDELALEQGLQLNSFNNIRQAESRKRGGK